MSARTRALAVAAAALTALALQIAFPAVAQPPPSLKTVDGKEVALTGRPGITYVVFAARWCGSPCEEDLTAVRELAGRFARQGMRVVVVGTGKRQTQEEFVRWARGAGMGGALVFDADGKLEKAFEVAVLPWHVVVDSKGAVLHASDGVPDATAVAGWLGGPSGR